MKGVGDSHKTGGNFYIHILYKPALYISEEKRFFAGFMCFVLFTLHTITTHALMYLIQCMYVLMCIYDTLTF
jgi:hypothetical protein